MKKFYLTRNICDPDYVHIFSGHSPPTLENGFFINTLQCYAVDLLQTSEPAIADIVPEPGQYVAVKLVKESQHESGT